MRVGFSRHYRENSRHTHVLSWEYFQRRTPGLIGRIGMAGNTRRTKAQSKPYYSDYSPTRLLIHKMCTSHYLDLFITIIIGLNVITMSMEHYQQPKELEKALTICNYIFTLIFVLESVFKLVAFGFRRFFKDKWNQLDLAIVLLSIMGITLEEIDGNTLPINPTIIRIMRVLRIARVLKLLKMAVGMRALLDTVMQALPQVGNLGLLFMLLFFIFAALGVELFGDLICDELHPCEGLGRYATFKNFGMAFLLLFRVSTGDNWNGIMKDTLRDCGQDSTTTCYNTVVSPIYFVSFVLTAQFVLVNVVIAVLMKHLEESNKEAKEEAELEAELELERQLTGGNMEARSPQHNPLALGMDRTSSGGSPWRSGGGGGGGDGPMESPTADITRDSVNIRADSPSCLEPPLECDQREAQFDSVSLVVQSSAETELSLMDNLSGSICHFYALPPQPRKHSSDKKIPLAEMEALSLASEKSSSLNLTDDSGPGDSNPFFISSQECNSEQLDPGEPLEENLLSVRKPAVVRTHSLPNDSYMFENTAPAPDQLIAQNQGSQHTVDPYRAQSGSRGSVCSQPEERSQLTVPADFFRPISPHSLSDSECIPRLPPPRRTHTLSRTLRRQVAVSTDSQEALCPDGGGSAEGLVNLGLPLSPTTSPSSSLSPPLLPARPHPPQEDLEVSLLTRGGGGDVVPDNCDGFVRARQLKRFHSADTTQGCSVPPPRLPRPYSWLDYPTEVCSSGESSPRRSPSSSFVSQIQPSPQRRKKKMSPPCISVDPPTDESGLYPPGVVMVGGGLGLPPPLPSRDTFLRRRAPSSDSFDLGVGGEGSVQEGGATKLLTPPREDKL
ncbi:hypothetical protein PBY51_001319 [Eleginops maclovinus]|uniref:Ion transport domain-containing protein n=1 Tax=Eleginops maclovinus TaxID=56733 RepID=A0AAN8A5H5_ELEMC|nr:hypothetical protein PBY51_001319 [Eleginops maclovinus]